MIGSVGISWSGVDEVGRALDDLCETIQLGVQAAADRYGNRATAEMRASHDRDAHEIQRYVNRTWYLTHSIWYDVQWMSDRRLRLRMYTPAYYAEAVEFGTPRSKPYPFFWPAVYGREPEARQRVIAALVGGLAEHERWVRSGFGGRVTARLFAVAEPQLPRIDAMIANLGEAISDVEQRLGL